MMHVVMRVVWWLTRWLSGEEEKLPLPEREDPRTAATRRKIERSQDP